MVALSEIFLWGRVPTDGVHDRRLRHHGCFGGMAALCLAEGLDDLKTRLGRIIVGFDYDKNPVLASQLNAAGAMATC